LLFTILPSENVVENVIISDHSSRLTKAFFFNQFSG